MRTSGGSMLIYRQYWKCPRGRPYSKVQQKGERTETEVEVERKVDGEMKMVKETIVTQEPSIMWTAPASYIEISEEEYNKLKASFESEAVRHMKREKKIFKEKSNEGKK